MRKIDVLMILGVVGLIVSVTGPVTAEATAGLVNSFTVSWMLGEDPGGFVGSPVYCDLDGDGQDEAIVPIGANDAATTYVEAVDPRTGSRLWRSATGGAGFAYPLCRDVDADGVLDVLSAGRFGDVRALSGVDGTALWSMNALNPGEVVDGNTYAPVSAPERPDVVFVTIGGGGGSAAARNPGALLAIDLDGNILARWDEPNQAEFYSAPAVKSLGPHGRIILIAVGSGGETLPGSLHFLVYNTRFKFFYSYAEIPSACQIGGFVASPVFGDITGDRFGIPEVVAADHCGSVVAANLLGQELWRRDTQWLYVVSNPLLTDLNGDGVLDVAVVSTALNFSLPDTIFMTDASLETFDGGSGDLIWSSPMKQPVFSSPVAADVNGDGVEDIWVATLSFFIPSEITVYSGTDGSELVAYGSVNWVGTPVLNDADGDGAIDVLVIDSPPGFALPLPPVNTILLNLPGVPFDADASWSGFRGPDNDGYRR